MINDLNGLEVVAIRNLIELYPWLVEVARERKANQGTQTVNQPQPAPKPRLIEAVDKAIRFIEWHVDENYSHEILADCRHSLAAERKREEALEPLLRHVVLWYNRKVNKENGADEILMHNIANYLRHATHLDALDGGGE